MDLLPEMLQKQPLALHKLWKMTWVGPYLKRPEQPFQRNCIACLMFLYLPIWTKAPTFQEVKDRGYPEQGYPVCKEDENGLCDDRIANQSVKYKPSLLPDDRISSQSIKYKSKGTSSSTNESSVIQLTSLSSFIFLIFSILCL